MSTETSVDVEMVPGQEFDPYGDASPMPQVAGQDSENLEAAFKQETKNTAHPSVDSLPGLEPHRDQQTSIHNTSLQSHGAVANDNLPGLDLNHTNGVSSISKMISDSITEQEINTMDQGEDNHIKPLPSQAEDTAQPKDSASGNIDNSKLRDGANSTNPKEDTEILDAELVLQDISLQEEQPNGNVAPEVEYDSSAAESSSDETSSTDSDDSGDSEEEDYELLDPIEQARRLMEGDGSDDEGGKVAPGGTLRTANEKEDEAVEIPDIKIAPDTKIEELGRIEAVVDNMILIKAKTSGEYQVLESGSVLCTLERVVIGVIAETLGRVREPLYCVRFSNTQTISAFGLERNTTIYYIPEHSYFVFTQALQGIKGSDASNINDEEVGGDEIEFSDDEAEAEYKRQKKLQKQDRKAQRGVPGRGRGDFPRGPPRTQEYPAASSLSYDEVSMDEQLYTPLVRPSSMNNPGPSTSHEQANGGYSRGPGGVRGFGGRGRGGNRGRTDRNNNYSMRGQQTTTPAPQQNIPTYPFTQQQNQYIQPQVLPPQLPYQSQGFQPPHLYNQYTQVQFPGQQHPYPQQFNQNSQWPGFSQSQQQMQQVPFQANPGQNGMPHLPPGAFYNPAFFTSQPGNPPG